MKSKKDVRSLVITSSFLLGAILTSQQKKAFAECGIGSLGGPISGCNTTIGEYCFKENTTGSITAALEGNGTNNYYPVEATAENGASDSATLNFDAGTTPQSFNGYSFSAPTNTSVDFTFQFQTPAVAHTDGTNGRVTLPVKVTTSYAQYDPGFGGFWYGIDPIEEYEKNIYVDHINQQPVLELLPALYTAEVQEGELQDVFVTADVSDVEGNYVDVIFELATDSSFTTIFTSKSGTYNVQALPSGTQVEHTFSQIPAAQYNWRVRVTETDGVQACHGYPNADPPIDFFSMDERQIILTTAADPTPTPTALPEPTATPVPDPTATNTPGPTATPDPDAPNNETRIEVHLFRDDDLDGEHDAGTEPNLANITVWVTDSSGNTQEYETDDNGRFTANVQSGQVTIEVDQSDPDLPEGGWITTTSNGGSNPQYVSVNETETIRISSIGYSKDSSRTPASSHMTELPKTGVDYAIIQASTISASILLVVGIGFLLSGLSLKYTPDRLVLLKGMNYKRMYHRTLRRIYKKHF